MFGIKPSASQDARKQNFCDGFVLPDMSITVNPLITSLSVSVLCFDTLDQTFLIKYT